MGKMEPTSQLKHLLSAFVSFYLLVSAVSCDYKVHALNEPPIVIITQPTINAEYFQGEPVPFGGMCTDNEDGLIVDADAYAWTSDIDGELGVGDSFTLNDLSLGEHRITLTAKDHKGLSATSSVIIDIKPGERPELIVDCRANLSPDPIDREEFNLLYKTSKNFDCKNLSYYDLSGLNFSRVSLR
ncbi:MAG: hypothetical protein PVH44_03640, partial [Desulfobacterales bacterium]